MIRHNPYLQLAVAFVVAIIIGVVLHSWFWGVAVFILSMFIFIWVLDWIFGSALKGKIETNDEMKLLLYSLRAIGVVKNDLPQNLRGWCNSLGLFVQLKKANKIERLQAGDKNHSHVDAWLENSSDGQWKIEKYESGDWEKLVSPTLKIAVWLQNRHGLPEACVGDFQKAIEKYQKEGYMELPDVSQATKKC